MVFGRHTASTEGDAANLDLGDGSFLNKYTQTILIELLEFVDAHCLMNAEVLLLLEDIQARRMSEAQSIPLPPPSK